MSDHPTTTPDVPPRRGGRRIASAIVGGVGIAALVGVLVAAPWDADRRQVYADQWIVWTEPATAEVEALATSLELTETGRRIFFASRPQIESAATFDEHCPVEADIVLGCYHRGQIFVYEVADERLAGTVESTTAHELLHAWYDRLPVTQKVRVDALIADVVANLPEDDPTIAIVDSYPADQRAGEWHSRLGTSYAKLPIELEEHFSEVFVTRTAVVSFDETSRAQIDAYNTQIAQLSAELDAASADLQARSAAYDATLATVNADVEAFNSRAATGGFATQSQFDAERAALLTRQAALEAERTQLNADVESYNAKLTELADLDAERAELYSHLDSHAAPESTN